MRLHWASISKRISSLLRSSYRSFLLTLVQLQLCKADHRNHWCPEIVVALYSSLLNRGSFWQLFTRATAVAPALPKRGHTNPIQLSTLLSAQIQNSPTVAVENKPYPSENQHSIIYTPPEKPTQPKHSADSFSLSSLASNLSPWTSILSRCVEWCAGNAYALQHSSSPSQSSSLSFQTRVITTGVLCSGVS